MLLRALWWTLAICGLLSALAAGALAAPAHADGIVGANMPVETEHLFITVDHRYASVRRSLDVRNQHSRPAQARFLLRAPVDTIVDQFAYWNDGSRIVGRVIGRWTARRVYGHITGFDRDPGLVTLQSPGQYSFQVFPVPPKGTKRIEFRYRRWLPRQGRWVELQTHLAHPDATVLVELRHPLPAAALESPTHQIQVLERTAHSITLRLVGGSGTRLLLRYRAENTTEPVVAYGERSNRRLRAVFVDIRAPEPPSALPGQRVNLVVDRSETMSTEDSKRAQALAAALTAALRPNDRVIVDNVDGEADGGLLEAVRKAFKGSMKQQQPARIIVISNGRAPDHELGYAARTARSLRLECALSGRSCRHVRLAIVGDGISELALAFQAGHYRLPKLASANRQARLLLGHALTDLRLSVTTGSIDEIFPTEIPALLPGEQTTVVLRTSGRGRLQIHGNHSGVPVSYPVTVSIEPRESQWIRQQWVARCIESLPRNGVDESARRAAAQAGIVTRVTSFFAAPESELDELARRMLEREKRQPGSGQFATGSEPERSRGRKHVEALVRPLSARPRNVEQYSAWLRSQNRRNRVAQRCTAQ